MDKQPQKALDKSHSSKRESTSDSEPESDSVCDCTDEEPNAPKCPPKSRRRGATRIARRSLKRVDSADDSNDTSSHGKKKSTGERGSILEYKRTNRVWNEKLHVYEEVETVDRPTNDFDEYAFTVKRCLDEKGHYLFTEVKINSDVLRSALQKVMVNVKGVSLERLQPSVDPDDMFNYLEDIRTYAEKAIKPSLAKEKKGSKRHRSFKETYEVCQLLLAYLDKDYAETKKTLYPMLEAGNINYDLLWALFKPNALVYMATYGSPDEPRCFKVDYCFKNKLPTRGEWYAVEGRYLDFDGKEFGFGSIQVDIDAFKGPRKITSLKCYPLEYHRHAEDLKKRLIERGKKFVSLSGMNYRFHDGLAFQKVKKHVAKININGRIMIDAGTFVRVNPNYSISKVKTSDDVFASENDDGGSGGSQEGSDVDAQDPSSVAPFEPVQKGLGRQEKKTFSEEDFLVASPVVLGFALGHKIWGEFAVSGVQEIKWEEGAFESLIIPKGQKDIIRALVESHRFEAARTIDDVVEGKGKGLVVLLHGKPGTGKTLSAEGCAELLKCPLYSVSAGDLGTTPVVLQERLQEILDVAHTWGALLLLDEADVFLEQRQVHDYHRNAMVSIFLRMLEYYRGVLFLTTNRVETFDHAFQSRIHIALRYGDLTPQTRKSIWKIFLGKAQAMESDNVSTWTDEDYDVLSRKPLNGRQIKNAARSAQALALNRGDTLSMEHIKRVMDIGELFDQDLQGGEAFKDAMHSYT